MDRASLIQLLPDRIVRVQRPHPLRVAIDGVDGVGKTNFTDELVEPIRSLSRPVIRSSIDGFHHPRSVRYRLGRQSPEGYFRDSFNYPALKEVLLAPLGPGGSRKYRQAGSDYRTDSEVIFPEEIAPTDAVLLFDGIFLLRPELRGHWDFAIFLDAPFEVTVRRAARRDGSFPKVNAPENRRYVEGQKLYLRSCDPKRLATVVIDCEDLSAPGIIAVE
jgi:uridine kinase